MTFACQDIPTQLLVVSPTTISAAAADRKGWPLGIYYSITRTISSELGSTMTMRPSAGTKYS